MRPESEWGLNAIRKAVCMKYVITRKPLMSRNNTKDESLQFLHYFTHSFSYRQSEELVLCTLNDNLKSAMILRCSYATYSKENPMNKKETGQCSTTTCLARRIISTSSSTLKSFISKNNIHFHERY